MPDGTLTDLPPLDPRERARVHDWLRRYGRRTTGLTPVTEHRYAARYRAYRIGMAATGLVALFFAAQVTWHLATGGAADAPVRLVSFVAAYLALAGGSLLGLRHQRRADDRIAAGLPQRVARPAAVRPVDLLGGWFLVAVAVSYLGGLGAGVTSLLAAADPTDRALSAAFTVAAALVAGYATAVVRQVMSRPAIASDEASLADDDAMRREDSRLAVAPYLAVLALVAGVGTSSGSWLLWLYLGYAAAAALTWTASLLAYRRAATDVRTAP